MAAKQMKLVKWLLLKSLIDHFSGTQPAQMNDNKLIFKHDNHVLISRSTSYRETISASEVPQPECQRCSQSS